jgi:tRNA threonylcarbamoyladenosine biosynthesis protein TsaB
MRLLILDTATEALSVALYDGEAVVAHRFEVIGRGHAERLLPVIREVLDEVRWPMRTLDAIAVGRGPGAFTGVRIGVSVAQGLAFGLEIPVVGISDLQAVAMGAVTRAGRSGLHAQFVVVALDARMGEVYASLCQVTETGVDLIWEILCAPEALPGRVGACGSVILAGHGFAAHPDLAAAFSSVVASYPDELPDAHCMASIAAERVRAGSAGAADTVEPVYLRDDVAHRSASK